MDQCCAVALHLFWKYAGVCPGKYQMTKADCVQAAVRLGKLREDTYEALDQIPIRVERAGIFMQTYRCTEINKHAADLYSAILDALQHILGWYKRKAGG